MRQSQKDVRHSGVRVDCIDDRVDRTGVFVEAVEFDFVAIALPKPATETTASVTATTSATESTILATNSKVSATVNFVAGFGNCRLCRQCVPSLKTIN